MILLLKIVVNIYPTFDENALTHDFTTLTCIDSLKLCLVTIFVFYFQKLVFGNIKKKQFTYIFKIKNMFG